MSHSAKARPIILEEYFDFVSPDQIRIRGHRIGIEHVLHEYARLGRTPEQIAADLPTLTLEEVYATILYYLRNRLAIDAYMEEWIEAGRRAWLEQQRNPTAGLLKVRERRASRDSEPPAG